jgi:nucleoid-associated protein YgaU
MGRMRIRLVAGALVALCWATGLTGVSPAEAQQGSPGAATVDKAGGSGTDQRGQLFEGAFDSGFSAAYWVEGFTKGDRVKVVTDASKGQTPPCALLLLPGTDDTNVSAGTPMLDLDSASRGGSHSVQRFTATETGTYILVMTNDDVNLGSSLECLTAPSGKRFTFTVTASDGSGSGSAGASQSGGSGTSSSSAGVSTHVVQPGQSLWAIARNVFGTTVSNARIATEVDRIWQLNANRMGTGDPDLIFAGFKLRLT